MKILSIKNGVDLSIPETGIVVKCQRVKNVAVKNAAYKHTT